MTLVVGSFVYSMEKLPKQDQPKATMSPATNLSEMTNIDDFKQVLSNGANPNYTNRELQEPGNSDNLKNRAAIRFLYGAQLSTQGLKGLIMALPFNLPSQHDQNWNPTMIEALQFIWEAIIRGDEEQFKDNLSRILSAISNPEDVKKLLNFRQLMPGEEGQFWVTREAIIPIELAAARGRINFVNQVLPYSDLNQTFALEWAAVNGRLNVVETLLNNSINRDHIQRALRLISERFHLPDLIGQTEQITLDPQYRTLLTAIGSSESEIIRVIKALQQQLLPAPTGKLPLPPPTKGKGGGWVWCPFPFGSR
jgi:F0F1-type ATP synthase delta subunit